MRSMLRGLNNRWYQVQISFQRTIWLPSRRPPNYNNQSLYKNWALKSNCELFARMNISRQCRNGDMDEYFSHEDQGSPPSLSDMENLTLCTKSDPIEFLEKFATSSQYDPPVVEAKIIRGSVIVSMVPAKSCSTFSDYAEKVFLTYLLRNLQSTKLQDVVWYQYIANSLKNSVRQKRDPATASYSTAVPPLLKAGNFFPKGSK